MANVWRSSGATSTQSLPQLQSPSTQSLTSTAQVQQQLLSGQTVSSISRNQQHSQQHSLSSSQQQTPQSQQPSTSSSQQQTPQSQQPSTSSSQQQTPQSQQPSISSSQQQTPQSQQPSTSSSQHQTPPTSTLEQVIASLKDIKDSTDLDKLIRTINNLLPQKFRRNHIGEIASSQIQDKDWWISSVYGGDALLKFVNVHTGNKEYIFSDSKEGTRVITKILQTIGRAHWVVGVFCIGAYLVENFEKVSENQRECFCLLNRMLRLATNVKTLKDVIPEDGNEIEYAVELIVDGSIMCISQMESNTLFRFLKASVNSQKLEKLSKQIDQEYVALNFAISTKIATNQPKMLPIKRPNKPVHAVGIEDPKEEVIQLLKFTPGDESPLAVVIYGVGGIGKSTLAEAVLADDRVNLDNYARVYFEDPNKKKIKEKQEIILNDAFPIHQPRKLRDCVDGREQLRQAFLSEIEPVMLFIDNVSRSSDLEDLLPDDLQSLPKRSTILVTTRKLDATDVLRERGLERKSYTVKTLSNEEAAKILCKDIIREDDYLKNISRQIERILKICGGFPLVLETVRADLAKVRYNAEDCQMLDALEMGKHIRSENLSENLVEFVYNEFETDTKAAFLDICCFFNGWYRRHVDYILGVRQVASIEEAGLLTSVVVGSEEGVNAGEHQIIVSDIVRLRGRRMAEEKSTRLMDYLSWEEATETKKGLRKIEGVWLEGDSSEFVLEERHLNFTAKSLRILALGNNIRTTGQNRTRFEELRYLKVGRGMRQLPMQFEVLDKLREYDGPVFIDGVRLYQLPRRLSTIKVRFDAEEPNPEEAAIPNDVLRELHLCESWHIAQLSYRFHMFSALKILITGSTWEVEELPEEVCYLSSLEKLSLRGSGRLRRLPESFRLLMSLTHLDLSSCTALEDLPVSFNELGRLKHLILSGCSSLTNRSGVIEKLAALEYLDVTNCGNLTLDPSSLRNSLNIIP